MIVFEMDMADIHRFKKLNVGYNYHIVPLDMFRDKAVSIKDYSKISVMYLTVKSNCSKARSVQA